MDFQASPTEYVPRQSQGATLEELMNSAERVEKKACRFSPELDQALFHGSSDRRCAPHSSTDPGWKQKYIAKFSASNDTYSGVVKAEFIAMRLSHLAGLNVAPVKNGRGCSKGRFAELSAWTAYWQNKGGTVKP
ncbi:MAG: hypothetical protein Q9M45_14605 [Robiginitomaculum sp.]|nr:hypothetical protein [Robiginitomaculum sp.]